MIFHDGYNLFDMDNNLKLLESDDNFPPGDFMVDYYGMSLEELFSRI